MRSGVMVVLLGIVSCGPTSQPPATTPGPDFSVPLGASARGPRTGTSSSVLMLLAHRPAFGPTTVVEVRAVENGYVLNSRRSFCRNSQATSIEAENGQAELERLLPVLDSTRMSEADPCRLPGRDAAYWIVARGPAASQKRSRMFRAAEIVSECNEFHAAARTLMRLAGLDCRTKACVREIEESTGKFVCP